MADQQFSEPVKWVFLAAIGVLIRELLGRLRRSTRTAGLTREQVAEMIAGHSKQMRDASYYDQRLMDIETLADERHGTVMAMLEEIHKRLARRSISGGD